MKYFVDIDDTICVTPNVDGVNRYDLSVPTKHRIEHINMLYDTGHHITYWTARGSTTGIDWSNFTEEQLLSWGCKFHECLLGKPSFDVYVCDKSMNDRDFFNECDNEHGFASRSSE